MLGEMKKIVYFRSQAQIFFFFSELEQDEYNMV